MATRWCCATAPNAARGSAAPPIQNAGRPKPIGKLTGADLKQAEALIPLLNEESAKSREMVAKVLGDNPAAAASVKPSTYATDIDCDECGKPMTIRNSPPRLLFGLQRLPQMQKHRRRSGEIDRGTRPE